MARTLDCTVVTPTGEAFAAAASYVDLPVWDGQLGVQPGRSPLLVKLGAGTLRVTLATGGVETRVVAGGFAQIKPDGVVIITQDALEIGSIDRTKAQAELQAALALPAVGDDASKVRDAAVARARAIVRAAR